MDTTTAAFIPQAKPQPVAQAPVTQSTASVQQPASAAPQTITASDGTVLDVGVVNLAKAIRQKESNGDYNAIGDNGTSHGAYQWQPGNFAKDAQQFGLDPNDFSPVNQDKVAYAQINAYKQAGYTPDQIASLWNSGKPDATGNVGVKNINGKPVSYDTPKYVADVMSYFNQNKAQNPGDSSQPQDLLSQTGSQPQSPSVGGFLKNTVQSGANFLGNTADALLHPLQTIQNVGGTAVGGLQELGGQTNDNTAKFDSLKNYFSQRYGSVDNLLHTAYTDPVGLAADVSAALGIGGGIAGAVGKGAEVAGLGQAALDAGGADFVAGAEGATNATRATAGSGLAGGLQTAAEAAGKASVLTNPLTPVVAGAGALLNKVADISDVVKNPSSYTLEEMANSTRPNISQQVETALNEKISSLGETGAEYQPLRENPTPIETSPEFLDDAIRKAANVDVVDGIIKANSSSIIRDSGDIKELQGIYNLYKPDFLNRTMDSNKLLNLRQDLADTANYNKGLTKNIQRVADNVRDSLNETYRPQVPGLAEKDATYSAQIKELKALRKGFIDKDGNLLESATNKIANSLGKGKDLQLARLEEIVPGITRKLEVMKTIEAFGKPGFTTSLIEKGGLASGIIQGDIKTVAAAATSLILSDPRIAIPLLRTLGGNIQLIKTVMANLAKFTTIGVVGNNSVSGSQGQSLPQQETAPQTEQSGTSPQENQLDQNSLSSNLNVNNNFDTQAALKAGYTQKEINDFLATQK